MRGFRSIAVDDALGGGCAGRARERPARLILSFGDAVRGWTASAAAARAAGRKSRLNGPAPTAPQVRLSQTRRIVGSSGSASLVSPAGHSASMGRLVERTGRRCTPGPVRAPRRSGRHQLTGPRPAPLPTVPDHQRVLRPRPSGLRRWREPHQHLARMAAAGRVRHLRGRHQREFAGSRPGCSATPCAASVSRIMDTKRTWRERSDRPRMNSRSGSASSGRMGRSTQGMPSAKRRTRTSRAG